MRGPGGFEIAVKQNAAGDSGSSGGVFSQLLELIQSLPQGCQMVFNLFAIEGYSHKEIAEMLGVSEGTSKSQFARAKNLLQTKLLKESSYYERYGEAKV